MAVRDRPCTFPVDMSGDTTLYRMGAEYCGKGGGGGGGVKRVNRGGGTPP